MTTLPACQNSPPLLEREAHNGGHFTLLRLFILGEGPSQTAFALRSAFCARFGQIYG